MLKSVLSCHSRLRAGISFPTLAREIKPKRERVTVVGELDSLKNRPPAFCFCAPCTFSQKQVDTFVVFVDICYVRRSLRST